MGQFRLGDGLAYLDEWILWQHRRQLANLAVLIMVVLGFLLGIPHSWGKLAWYPTQQYQMLGLEWCTVTMRRSLMRNRVLQIQGMADTLRQAMEAQAQVTVRELASFPGNVGAAQEGARKAGYYMAKINAEMARMIKQAQGQYDTKVTPTREWLTVILWILGWTDWDLWAHFRNSPSVDTVSTDASTHTAGAHRQPWQRGDYRQTVRFTQQERGPTFPVRCGAARVLVMGIVEHYGLKGQVGQPITITNETDNTMNKKLLSKQRAKSTQASDLALRFQDYLDARNITVTAIFASGQTMVNGRQSDRLSRTKPKWFEWALPRRTFDE